MCLARDPATMAHSKGPPTPLRKQDSSSSTSADTKTVNRTSPALADLDLSHLTSEEIGAIQKVLKKQESFERQAKVRAEQIEKAIRRYEATLAARESHPPRSKDDDLRMCRLCFVRKFTDGLGVTCGDCLHRVCANCSSQVVDGGASSPTPKHRFKHKKRWRCNLCKLQRDYLCVTGRWYYQDDTGRDTSAEYRRSRKQSQGNPPPRRRVVRSAQSDLEERFVHRNVEAIKRNSWDSGKHYKSDTEASSTCLLQSFARESLNGKKTVTRRRRRSSQLRQISCDSPGENLTQESDDGEWMNRALARRASHRRPLRRRRYGVTEATDKSPEGSQVLKASGQQASGSEDERQVSVADAERSPSNRRRSRPSIHGRRSPSGAAAPKEPPMEGGQTVISSAAERAKEARGKYKRTGSVKADFMGKLSQRAMERFRRRSRSESELNIPEQPPQQETTIYVRDDSEEVTIQKDQNDTSCKTRGFGLEVVGGRQDSDGWLRTFVTRVVVDGPADKVVVHKGDEILEWNEQSLENKTFEQVRLIVDQPCGDELKLRIVRYQAHRATADTLAAKRGSSVSIESEVYHRRKKISVGMRNSINTEQYKELFTPAPEETTGISGHRAGSRRRLPVPPLSSSGSCSSSARTSAPRVELTPAENQNLGELCMQLMLREETKELVVMLTEAKGLKVREGDPLGQPPSPYVNIYQLPYRRESLRYRSPTIPATATPAWNKTFVFPNIAQSEIAGLSLEFTVWDERPDCMNTFLGEVLIDLQDEALSGKPVWYPLADHDENIGELPCTTPPSVVLARIHQQQQHQAMGLGLMDAPHLLTPYLTGSGGVGHKELARCPSDSVREYGRGREGLMPLSVEAASQLAMEDRFDRLPLSRHRSCPSAGCNTYNKSDLPQIIVAGPSEDTWPDMFNERRKRSSSSFGSSIAGSSIAGSDWESCTSYSSGSRNSMDSDYHFRLSTCSMPRPAPDGEDGMITEPGPGQVLLENFNGRPCGFIKLAMAVSKGSLEVEIICATGLLFHGESESLDTYVKTYLLEGDRQLVKRKTKVMHATCEPHYAQTLKYSACDITGRRLQVMLWRKTKIRESNQCLGEARITLDILEETTHSTAWYTLFPSGAYESLKSSQSLELLKF
ncbi:regulating synaptic membrane exocytosis protein 2-like isoform X1 [Asterias rubens]|uniref:regulating synaptic membrane exocytosis protein 2-like isoform X1 n=1 Tax=Asterias rubens TaxID=7604 RepID=UPI001455A208|nr:regulating synaptic membrane exocytosis protein 2-like isoform X1 [Asterias rubens]